jgi:hypothetical protein
MSVPFSANELGFGVGLSACAALDSVSPLQKGRVSGSNFIEIEIGQAITLAQRDMRMAGRARTPTLTRMALVGAGVQHGCALLRKKGRWFDTALVVLALVILQVRYGFLPA